MFDELKYRWALRRFLKHRKAAFQSYNQVPDEPDAEGMNFPKYQAGRTVNFYTYTLDKFRSDYLIEQANIYHVPTPGNEDDWESHAFATTDEERYLTASAAQKLRSDIRAEQKADWDYWANRVTLALALIGSIFGVLAFFKK
ncbi:hypothetical protein [Tardiphaga sp.]|uniref:hypothetical protein n=1 Tax=Tardiphaga sp. TaxID=1926292 RepID=UPI002631145F|nr:hypothetical protein [Tardiphaga sp.]MDB5616174.1 hypothetical protein [Tardiphaga sp.]